MSQTSTNTRKTRKIAAIAAGALALGIGATYTLASWTDSEWVWGGFNGEAGVGTNMFEVEQNTGAVWTDRETNPGGELSFTTGALALTPGDIVYAPVSLRAKANSIGGTVTLQGAEPAADIVINDADGDLWEAMRVTVYTSADETAPACAAGTFTAADWTAVAGITDVQLSTGATPTTGAQTLAAGVAPNAGAPQHYCFELSLPTDAQEIAEGAGINLMGLSIAPAWEFAAVSN